MGMSERVLIVDSSVVVREQIEPVLGEAGLRVQFCSDTNAACELIRQHRPKLVLLDALMARSDKTLCRRLRSCFPEIHLPIILLVPPVSTNISAFFCARDADDFICCPFQDDELLVRVLSRLNKVAESPVEERPQVDYRFLAGIAKLANSDLDSTQILQRVVATIGQVIEVHRCSITMVREDDAFGYVMAANDDPELNGLKIELNKYPEIKETIKTGKTLLIDNIYRHPLMEGVRPYIERLGFNSLLVLPMVDKQRVIGVLVVRTARTIEGFTEDEISFCQLVANVATSALRYARLAESQVRKTPDSPFFAEDSVPSNGSTQEPRLDMAAHDLRVMVSVIDGYCLLLQETETENFSAQQSEFLDGLMTGCCRLVELTSNLLDFSRIESGALDLKLFPIDLRQLLETAVRDMFPLLRRREITLSINSRLAKLPAYCDAENIRRVFYNLMTNAIKYAPQGGEIELSFHSDEDNAYVSLSDNGPGIEANLLPRLFEEFTYGRSPDGQPGNGLGLSICKKIVDAHQGRIWAESVLGQGSRFTFCLPKTA